MSAVRKLIYAFITVIVGQTLTWTTAQVSAPYYLHTCHSLRGWLDSRYLMTRPDSPALNLNGLNDSKKQTEEELASDPKLSLSNFFL